MSADHDRVMVTVNVIYTFIDEQWPLKEFIEIVTAKVPQEFTSSARVAFVRGAYDEGDHFEVSYDRPETDREYAERMQRYAEYEAEDKRRERATYEALKKKFG